MVEIRALKRIMDLISEGAELPVLCFVDEVLRGTNTVERIAASTEILKTMAEGNCICFAATHDIELTHLLEAVYQNYHLRNRLKRMIFSSAIRSLREGLLPAMQSSFLGSWDMKRRS